MTYAYKTEYYTEVYKILLAYGKKYIDKLPKKIFEDIKSKVNPEYNFEFNPTISFKEQNVKKEAVALIVAFKMQYWCDSEEEKNEYKQKLIENQIRHEKEKQDKYNVDNLFSKKPLENVEALDSLENNENDDIKEVTDLQIHKENVIIKLCRRIKKYILNIFRKEN